MTLIERAYLFAFTAHGGQKYGNDKPYTYHLKKVVEILEPYGEEAVVVGWLHDVIEDTPFKSMAQFINAGFSERIYLLVSLVSDETGGNRRERKQKTNLKQLWIGKENETALIVKAADRLANVREGGKNDMYRKEHRDFKLACYRKGLCDNLWEEMEKILCMNVVYPRKKR